MTTVREIVQWHKNIVLRSMVIILLIVAIVTTFSIIANNQVNNLKKIEISSYFTPGFFTIIVLIASFTFFYSGKMNDYKKEYTQRISDLEESVAKTKRWLNKIEHPDTHVNDCKQFISQWYEYLKDPDQRISFISKEVMLLSMITMILLFLSFTMINLPYLNAFNLICAAIIFTVGIIYVLTMWSMFEKIIEVYNIDLITLNQFIGILKGIND